MTDHQPPEKDGDPLNGEVLGKGDPGPNEKPRGGRKGRGKDKPKDGAEDQPTDASSSTGEDKAKGQRGGKAFGRQQTEKERKEEEDAAEPIGKALTIGGLDWRYPGWEPTPKDRAMVRMLKFCGNTDEDVASILDMSVETMQKHFHFELQYAKTMVIADLATRAVVRARQGNDVLTMFLLKTRGGSQFSERAGTMQALNEALDGKGEIDAKRREDILTRVLDVLAPKEKTAKGNSGKAGAAEQKTEGERS